MPNINTKTFVDIHTTGKRMEFGSVRAYDKFLKEHNARVISKKEVLESIEPKPEKKIDYKKLAVEAFMERAKYIKLAKERIAKEQYERRNGKNVSK